MVEYKTTYGYPYIDHMVPYPQYLCEDMEPYMPNIDVTILNSCLTKCKNRVSTEH